MLRAENALVVIAGAPQLFAGIFGMTVGAAWERRARISHTRDIRIADQRKDGMVKRRSAYLYLACLCHCAILGQNQTEQLQLLRLESSFVFFRELFPFVRETADDRVFLEPGFLHPDQL